MPASPCRPAVSEGRKPVLPAPDGRKQSYASICPDGRRALPKGTPGSLPLCNSCFRPERVFSLFPVGKHGKETLYAGRRGAVGQDGSGAVALAAKNALFPFFRLAGLPIRDTARRNRGTFRTGIRTSPVAVERRIVRPKTTSASCSVSSSSFPQPAAGSRGKRNGEKAEIGLIAASIAVFLSIKAIDIREPLAPNAFGEAGSLVNPTLLHICSLP